MQRPKDTNSFFGSWAYRTFPPLKPCTFVITSSRTLQCYWTTSPTERWEQCCASQRDEIEDTFLFTKLSFFYTLRLFLTLSSHDCIKIIDYMNMRMNKLLVFVCSVDFSLCSSGYYYCLVLSTTSCPTSMNLLRGLPVFLPGSSTFKYAVYSVCLPFFHWNHCSYYKVAQGSNARLNIINLPLKQPLA